MCLSSGFGGKDCRRPSPTEELSGFVCDLKYDDIPSPVRDRVKAAVLDGIGCGCFGAITPHGRIVGDFVRSLGGPEESTLWLGDFKGPASNIALALGTYIHSLDFDDYHKAKVHPSSAVLPAAFTVGEYLGSSGKDFLTSVVAGYEIMIRVALSVGPVSSRLRGWHLTGTCGVFGSAAAAGKLLGLSPKEMSWALGLAGTQASGLWAFNYDGAMTKRLHPGRSAQSGVIAAFLAKKGFTGPVRILDAEDGGLWRATSDSSDPARLTAGLGSDFECGSICMKPYAVCGSNHSAIDAARKIVAENGLTDEDIESITVFTSRVVKVQTGFDELPETVLQAQMSLKYAVAAAIIYGNVLTEQMRSECFRSERARRLMSRIVVQVDPEMDRLYPEHFCARVRILTNGGGKFEQDVLDPRGTNSYPLHWQDVVEKSRDLISSLIGNIKHEALVEAVGKMEERDDVRNITELLSSPGPVQINY